MGRQWRQKDLVLRSRRWWSQHGHWCHQGCPILERNQGFSQVWFRLGLKGRCPLRRKHERNQIRSPWCHSPRWCYPQRRWSNHPNRQTCLVRLLLDRLSKTSRTSLPCRSPMSRTSHGWYLLCLEQKERSRLRWRTDPRNPNVPGQGLLASQRILRFRFWTPCCHLWSSFPTMLLRSLADNCPRSIGRRKYCTQDRHCNKKEKGSFRRTPTTRSFLGQIINSCSLAPIFPCLSTNHNDNLAYLIPDKHVLILLLRKVLSSPCSG